MKKLLFLSVAVLFCLGLGYGGAVVSRVVAVYDGDTFRADLKDLPDLIGKNIPIRIAGVDTAELNSKDPNERALAILARDFSRAKLAAGKTIILKNIQRGKYFRIVADVYIDSNSLGDDLLAAGLAKKYQ